MVFSKGLIINRGFTILGLLEKFIATSKDQKKIEEARYDISQVHFNVYCSIGLSYLMELRVLDSGQ